MDITFLPHLNACLNATSGMLLAAGYYFIRRGRAAAHMRCMIAAVGVSICFLASYLTYHYYHGSTKFQGEGIVYPIYIAILLTHAVLAVVIVPLVLVTLLRARRGDFDRHRRIARWTLPLWFYVSVTGVVVYLLLYHFYPAR